MIEVLDVRKTYHGTGQHVKALDGVSLFIGKGEYVAVMGPSGCGKSTLLHLLGALDTPDSGEILVEGTSLGGLDENALTAFRRDRIGIVFQFFNLLPTMTVLENVMLPLVLRGMRPAQVRPQAMAMLEKVGMASRAGHRPSQISGGEMQRTAIARALIHRPVILLADEPTGNLDSKTGARILDLFGAIAAEKGTTLVIVTHSDEVARGAERLIHLTDGRVISDHRRVQHAP